MKKLSKVWRNTDRYTNPGPIQFYLDQEDENNKIAITLALMYQAKDEVAEEIRGLCHSIQNDTLFTEH